MAGIDIDWVRAEFPYPEGSGRERAQTEIILRLCDEVERLWGEVQWQDLRGAVVGGMVSGMMERSQASIQAMDVAGRSLGRELSAEMGRRRERQGDPAHHTAENCDAGEPGHRFAVSDLAAAHLGMSLTCEGEERGILLGLSATIDVQGGSPRTRVHLSTDIGEFDCAPDAECTVRPAPSD
ncbi:hypothetical protein [Propionibacterium sp.]|uniref:hypothetical protein n=1 Tax=Propionibacterium sp. TaxID=1977903 RepID=UPI0039E7E4C1